MADNTLWWVLGVAIVLIVLSGKSENIFSNLFAVIPGAAPADDYITFEDFSQPIELLTPFPAYYKTVDGNFIVTADCGGGNICPSVYVNGNGYLQKTYASSSNLFINESFYGQDVKIGMLITVEDASGGGGQCQASANLAINEIDVLDWYEFPSGDCSGFVNQYVSAELKTHLLDKNLVDVYFNGFYTATVQLEEPKLELRIDSNPGFHLDYVMYRVPFSCQFGDDEMLGIETFVSSQEVGIFSMRYPVTAFCPVHPALITSEIGGGSTTDDNLEIYTEMMAGNTLIVPSDETWTIYYRFNYVAAGILTPCIEGQGYNPNSSQCEDLIGIVYFCTQGVWDSNLQACASYPEVQTICDPGTSYNADLGVCVYFPPTQAICEPTMTGQPTVYNPVTGLCEYTPETFANCTTPYVFNPSTLVCQLFPEQIISCPPATAYDSNLNMCVGTPTIVSTLEQCVTVLGGEWQNVSGVMKCVFEPDTISQAEYCVNTLQGSWQEVEGTLKCVFEPEPFFICPTGMHWELINGIDRCVGYGGTIGQEVTLSEEVEEVGDGGIESFLKENVLYVILALVIIFIIYQNRKKIFGGKPK